MVQNFDEISNLYDAVYARKNYTALARYLSRWAHKVRKHPRVYDIGSGTGRLGVALQKQGIEVYGIEPSEGMAAIGLSRGIKSHKSKIQSIKSDFLDNNEPRDMVICSFDVLDYVQSASDFDDAMRNINEMVYHGGYLFVEGWNADTMGSVYEPLRQKYFACDGATWLRTSETTWYKHTNVFDIKFTFWKSDAAFPIVETHSLKPRFGKNLSWMVKYGFELEELKYDKYSVKAMFRKVHVPRSEV